MNANDFSQFNEAPASWNTRYITPEGFECQLTLRGDSGQEVLERANGALAFLQKAGCIPSTRPNNFSHSANSNGSQTKSNGNGDTSSHDNGWCPIHECAMKRWE